MAFLAWKVATSFRSMTTRQTLPDGTVLQPQEYGPTVSNTHPLGEYIEDYEYISNLGDLDANNGRTSSRRNSRVAPMPTFGTTDGKRPLFPYYLGAEYFMEHRRRQP
ncbi:MAG: YHYH protein [Bacteroidetes bacterium]|nr:YHYH protein [Bacteroidota bacterium]